MELAKQILQKAEEYKNYTANNLSTLIKHKSLSSQEKEVASEIKKMMEEAGFDEVKIDGLGNVIGRIGNGRKIIAIDGHIDTVDLGNLDAWEFDPLGGEIKDGYVLGRGTTDQTGGPVAAITAGRILKELGLGTDITLYVTAYNIEHKMQMLLLNVQSLLFRSVHVQALRCRVRILSREFYKYH